MPTPTFEDRVLAATSVTSALAVRMHEELDPTKGGFGWWSGYMDPRRIALLSEYLLSSVNGLAHSLIDASLQAHVYGERRTADNFWLRNVWESVPRTIPNPTPHDFLAAQKRGLRERRRDREGDLAAEHFFYHLAQAMDRLAACMIGVGALHCDIVGADWKDIEQATKRVETGGRRSLDDHGTPGRAAQEKLLRVVAEAVSTGPTDWLPWMLDFRDVNAHRAPKMSWNLMTGSGRRSDSMTTPFYLQPRWPAVEAMVNAPVDATDARHILLLRDPLATMYGFLDQVVEVVATASASMLDLWTRRRAEPTLLVQPGVQWKTVMERPQLGFNGFTQDVLKVQATEVYLHPDNAKRLQASKVMDADADFWRD
jgi:hypothetical protein